MKSNVVDVAEVLLERVAQQGLVTFDSKEIYAELCQESNFDKRCSYASFQRYLRNPFILHLHTTSYMVCFAKNTVIKEYGTLLMDCIDKYILAAAMQIYSRNYKTGKAWNAPTGQVRVARSNLDSIFQRCRLRDQTRGKVLDILKKEAGLRRVDPELLDRWFTGKFKNSKGKPKGVRRGLKRLEKRCVSLYPPSAARKGKSR